MTKQHLRNPASHAAVEGSVHIYEGAGIAEREGHVPLWLWIVAIVLVLWGVYYLVAYRNAPAPPA